MIEGLEHLPDLCMLYLQQNCIKKIEGLLDCTKLRQLNLAHNSISQVAGLSALTALTNLNISHNSIKELGALEGLLECPSLSSIDVSYNEIEVTEGVVEFWERVPNLACLYYHHNPGQRLMSQYRRRLIAGIAKLRFLDERPVLPIERVGAEAWQKAHREGGQEAGKSAENAAKQEFIEVDRHGSAKDREDHKKLSEAVGQRLAMAKARIEREEAEKKAAREAMEKGGATKPLSKKWKLVEEVVVERNEAELDEAKKKREAKEAANERARCSGHDGPIRGGAGPASFKADGDADRGPWPLDDEPMLWAQKQGAGAVDQMREKDAAAAGAAPQVAPPPGVNTEHRPDAREAARAGMSAFLGRKSDGGYGGKGKTECRHAYTEPPPQTQAPLSQPFFQPPSAGVLGCGKKAAAISRSELDEMD